MKFSDVLPPLRESMERAITAWRAQIGEAAIGAILEQWPSPDWGDVHPYATGRSHDAWVSVPGTGPSVTIQCPVEYSGYTERGYTRAGKETAYSWSRRRYGRYSLTALLDARLRDVTARVIGGAFHG